MMDKICENCKWYHQLAPGFQHGSCSMHAPVLKRVQRYKYDPVSGQTDTRVIEEQFESVFPTVVESFSCGDWEEQERIPYQEDGE